MSSFHTGIIYFISQEFEFGISGANGGMIYVDAMLTVLKYCLSDRHDAWEMNKLRTCVSQISTLESP